MWASFGQQSSTLWPRVVYHSLPTLWPSVVYYSLWLFKLLFSTMMLLLYKTSKIILQIIDHLQHLIENKEV